MTPTTFNVANGDITTLIADINTANTNGQADVINLAAGGTYTLTTANNATLGSNGLPTILGDGNHSLTINGNGATINRTGATAFRFFLLASGATAPNLTLNDLTISNGLASSATAPNNQGGAIYIQSGTLTINRSTITGNTATGATTSYGGGIYAAPTTKLYINQSTVSNNTGTYGGGVSNKGALTITSSTFSGNISTAEGGGGIAVRASGTGAIYNSTISGNKATNPSNGYGGGLLLTLYANVSVTNCTISNNTATGGLAGGGICVKNGALTLANSVLAGNLDVSGNQLYDISFFVPITANNTLIATMHTGAKTITGANNLIGSNTTPINAKIGPLQNNGGRTATVALLAGSPAIDKGSNALAVGPGAVPLVFDQRNLLRLVNGGISTTVDMGAYEFGATSTFVVDSAADVNDGNYTAGNLSLREAIALANVDSDVSTITFAAALAGQTLKLSAVGDSTFGPTALRVNTPIIIDGSNAPLLVLSRDTTAAANLRLFYVATTGTLTVQNITLSNGLAKGGAGGAGADQGGGGGAGLGGAILNQGTLNVIQSTLNGNQATGGAGGNASGAVGGGGGGGGLGFNGGTGLTAATAGGGGGGGITGNGGNGTAAAGGAGGATTGGAGGGPGVVGVNGSGTGGGGGGGGVLTGTNGAGGSGNFGAGGGGGGTIANGGAGGFGGGSGGTGAAASATAGFGAGAGGKGAGSPGGGGAGLGGALFNLGGTLNIVNSTLTGNTAAGGAAGTGTTLATGGSGFGGAVFNLNGTLSITNSTLSGNTVTAGTAAGTTPGTSAGGELFNLGHPTTAGITAAAAAVTLTNSILGNTTGGSDVVNQLLAGGTSATLTATAPNIILTAISTLGGTTTATGLIAGVTTANLNLQPLANNFGPTLTMALVAGSKALDVGTDNVLISPFNLVNDQRGTGSGRKAGAHVDIGAFEFDSPPTPVNDAYTVLAGAVNHVSTNGVLANDTDPDGDTLTAHVFSNPANGSLTLNSDGTFIYTPTNGFVGTDSFVYSVTDGHFHSGGPFKATVTLTVMGSLDVDGNGTMDPLTDGILILRYLFGFSGTTLTSGALGVGATRSTAAAITTYLVSIRPTVLDADGDGSATALTDGILILRYMFGFTGSTLISGAVGISATRTSATSIQSFLDQFNPLLAHQWADQVGPGAAAADLLTPAELQAATAVAIARWEASGLTAVQQARLQSASVQMADLSGNSLGQTHLNDVLIDSDAAGYGWFVDPTPFDDSEFQTSVGAHELQANSGSPAAGRMDLLTVVMHELGLVMGLSDLDPQVMAHGLMTDVLATGIRRLP